MRRIVLLPWQALKATFDDVGLLVINSLFWCLLSLPLLVLAASLLNAGAILGAPLVLLLGVLPMAPATSALHAVALRLLDEQPCTLWGFFGAMRGHVRLAWAMQALWLGGLLTLLVSIAFYGRLTGVPAVFVLALVLLLLFTLLVWLGMLVYLFPLLHLQPTPTLRGLLYTAGLLVLARPFFTLGTLLLMGGLLALSLAVPILLIGFTPAFLAVWGLLATRALIADAQALQAAQQQPVTEEQPPQPASDETHTER